MTRTAAGDTVQVKPSNNVYTTLVIIATIGAAMALMVVFLRARAIGIPLM